MGKDSYTLSVGPATSSYVELDGRQERERPLSFVDFLVDGRPLRECLNIPDDTACPDHETTALRDDWQPTAAVEYLEVQGFRPGEFEDGRVALLLCPVCGDVWCGALSMELVLTQRTVTWTNFGWQEGPEDEPELFPDQYFTFHRNEYEQLLQGLRERYEKPALIPQPVRGLFRLNGRSTSRK